MRLDPEVAEALGLAVNDGPRDVELENGVWLTMRPPQGQDWAAAKSALAKVAEIDRQLRAMAGRYAWSPRDVSALFDPETWGGAAEWCLAVELAPLIVSKVWRLDGDRRFDVEPKLETFVFLFKLGENLDRFLSAARAAERGLLTAKKE